MVPWGAAVDGLDYARSLAHLSPLEAAGRLRGSVRPIVLVSRRAQVMISPAVAPGLRELALMLPYSPLHHLLLEESGGPLVATSANLSGEPVLIEPKDVEARLGDVADGFLHHDRTIARPADDPVFRVLQASHGLCGWGAEPRRSNLTCRNPSRSPPSRSVPI